MNKNISYALLPIVAIFVFAAMAVGAGRTKSLPTRSGSSVTTVSSFAVASYVDTVKYYRESGVTALAFGLKWPDTLNIGKVIVRRVVSGKLTPAVAGDTLISLDTAVATAARTKAVTMAPLADEYWFFVTYGATVNDITDSSVIYVLNRTYAKY
jgi:hypothetical protein